MSIWISVGATNNCYNNKTIILATEDLVIVQIFLNNNGKGNYCNKMKERSGDSIHFANLMC